MSLDMKSLELHVQWHEVTVIDPQKWESNFHFIVHLKKRFTAFINAFFYEHKGIVNNETHEVFIQLRFSTSALQHPLVDILLIELNISEQVISKKVAFLKGIFFPSAQKNC